MNEKKQNMRSFDNSVQRSDYEQENTNYKIPLMGSTGRSISENIGDTVCEGPLAPRKIRYVGSIGWAGIGYCKDHKSIGTVFTESDTYPFPSLYHNSDFNHQVARDRELYQAKQDNWFNDSILPGAVVHGNVASPNVRSNTIWTVRGSKSERVNAQENDFGVDDTFPEGNAVDLFESVIHYFEKNKRLWLKNPPVFNAIKELMALFVENAIDNDPDQLKYSLSDVVLTATPRIRTQDINDWNFYPDNAEKYPKQPYDDDFRDDDVVSWLQVATISPYSRLKPYTEHQHNFKVTNEHFRKSPAFENDDLEQAMSEGRVFIVDFKEFHEQNIKMPPLLSFGARLYTPIAMFAVPREGGPLKTIAIQSTQHTPKNKWQYYFWKRFNFQNPKKPLSEIITPGDDYWTWQMAKTLFLSMYSMSSVIDHLSTHVYLGPVPVSFYRNIPKAHPLTALLEPHLMSLVANNHLGIFVETGTHPDIDGFGKHGFLTKMPHKLSGWRGASFVCATLKRKNEYDFFQHGTPINRNENRDFESIEDFPLYDDAGIYPIAREWVENYLSLYYLSDEDVVLDHELQMFCEETALVGKVNGFPNAVHTFEELVNLITSLIYWLTSNHGLEGLASAQKIGPLGYWSNRVPRTGEKKTEWDWFRILPPLNVGLATFCMSRVFVDLPHDWYRSLGKYPQGQFLHDPRVYPYLEKFQNDIFRLDEEIKLKNEQRRWAYNLLRPATLTCSPWN